MNSTKSHLELDMEPLFEEARKTGKWFHCAYQNLWFSPDELEQAQREFRFRWGPVNWELRNPQDQLDNLRRIAVCADNQAKEFSFRLKSEEAPSQVPTASESACASGFSKRSTRSTPRGPQPMKIEIEYDTNAFDRNGLSCCCAKTEVNNRRFWGFGQSWESAKQDLLKQIMADRPASHAPANETIEI